MTGPKKKRDRDILSSAEIRKMLRACGRSGKTCVRNRALVAFLWRSGARRGEALALVPHDLELDTGICRIRHGKGDKYRTVVIDEDACSFVREWMVVRDRIESVKRGSPLFCTCFDPGGKKIQPNYITELMAKLRKHAGIEKRVHAHGLRHAFADELQRERTPIMQIKQLLGHSSLAVTDVYLQGLSPQEAYDSIRARDGWKDKKDE